MTPSHKFGRSQLPCKLLVPTYTIQALALHPRYLLGVPTHQLNNLADICLTITPSFVLLFLLSSFHILFISGNAREIFPAQCLVVQPGHQLCAYTRACTSIVP